MGDYPQNNPVYAAMVHSMDQCVGRVLAKLEAKGLLGRTAIFFIGDNGGLIGNPRRPVTINLGLRAGKGSSYEGGVREPFMAYWPGVTKPGSVCDEPVISTDFYPTILEMLGARGDPNHNAAVDGLSLVPVLKDPSARLDRDAIYWHYPHYHPGGATPYGAVRARGWKLIEFYEDMHVELYNLKDDQAETTDLAEKMPERAAQLRRMLHDWRKAVGAQMPTPNPGYDPARDRGRPRRKGVNRKDLKHRDFAILRGGTIAKSDMGYTLETSGEATALLEAPRPFTKRAVFQMTMRTAFLSALLCIATVGTSGQQGSPPAMRSLTPPVLLPDGSEFKTWEAKPRFTKAYYVAQRHPQASDENPGTQERPFKTIGKAAAVLQPGERVVVGEGVYREHVRPARGGTGPTKMISYEAAPGAAAIIKGSKVFTETWTPSKHEGKAAKGAWQAKLDAKYFPDWNPFDIENVTKEQFDHMPWAHPLRGRLPYTLPRGMIFQEGKLLKQVTRYGVLASNPGSYWVDRPAQVIHIHPLGGGDPNGRLFEITTERVAFGPEKMGLGFIRVKGLVVEQVGNCFPMQQEGAISTWRGHHWIIEDCTVRWANGVGIDLGLQAGWWPQPEVIGKHICRRNVIEDIGVCGIAGIGVHGDFGLLIEDNVLRRCAYHNVERLFETGGIKTHRNTRCLIRRNLILDTLHGCGIWMDFTNDNSRCTQNVIIGSRSRFHGGIFIEASCRPNLIDHNIIWDTRGYGIYEHDCSNQIFAHNFIGRSTKAAVILRGKVTNRKLYGQPIASGGHRVVNNVFFDNKPNAVVQQKGKSEVAGNLDAGVQAGLDRETLTLTWSVAGKLPACAILDPVTHDFFGAERRRQGRDPGPFRDVPTKPSPVRLRPPTQPKPD